MAYYSHSMAYYSHRHGPPILGRVGHMCMGLLSSGKAESWLYLTVSCMGLPISGKADTCAGDVEAAPAEGETLGVALHLPWGRVEGDVRASSRQ